MAEWHEPAALLAPLVLADDERATLLRWWLILGAAASTPLSAVWLASLPYDYLLPPWSLFLGQAMTFAVLAMYSYAAVHTSRPARS